MEISIELLEELAAKKGYKLIPIKKYERFLPCKCGCNRRDHIYCSNCKTGHDYVVLKCKKCGLKAYGTNEATAKQHWNKVMSLLDQIVEEKPEDLKEIWETL